MIPEVGFRLYSLGVMTVVYLGLPVGAAFGLCYWNREKFMPPNFRTIKQAKSQ